MWTLRKTGACSAPLSHFFCPEGFQDRSHLRPACFTYFPYAIAPVFAVTEGLATDLNRLHVRFIFFDFKREQGRVIPTVNPVRIQRPLLKFAYPEGMWKGLFWYLSGIFQATLVKVDTWDLAGASDKCKLCGTKTDLYPVELPIPNIRAETVNEGDALSEILKLAGLFSIT